MELSQAHIVRFWSHVDKQDTSNCWKWKAAIFHDGYGAFNVDGKMYRAHRVAWQISNGREPHPGLEIAHAPKICHTPLCCNPSHLSEKTRLENEADKRLDETIAHGARNGQAKLTQEKVNQIPILREKGLVQSAIGKLLGVSKQQISNIERGKRWKKQ